MSRKALIVCITGPERPARIDGPGSGPAGSMPPHRSQETSARGEQLASLPDTRQLVGCRKCSRMQSLRWQANASSSADIGGIAASIAVVQAHRTPTGHSGGKGWVARMMHINGAQALPKIPVIAALAAFALSACNTTTGAGKDLQSTATAVTDTANDARTDRSCGPGATNYGHWTCPRMR
jgi:predicted small secreted protein